MLIANRVPSKISAFSRKLCDIERGIRHKQWVVIFSCLSSADKIWYFYYKHFSPVFIAIAICLICLIDLITFYANLMIDSPLYDSVSAMSLEAFWISDGVTQQGKIIRDFREKLLIWVNLFWLAIIDPAKCDKSSNCPYALSGSYGFSSDIYVSNNLQVFKDISIA